MSRWSRAYAESDGQRPDRSPTKAAPPPLFEQLKLRMAGVRGLVGPRYYRETLEEHVAKGGRRGKLSPVNVDGVPAMVSAEYPGGADVHFHVYVKGEKELRTYTKGGVRLS